MMTQLTDMGRVSGAYSVSVGSVQFKVVLRTIQEINHELVDSSTPC